MLKSITIDGFKLYNEQKTFPFSNLTLLAGVNGAGKSSCLQPFLLLRQSALKNTATTNLYLQGELVDLGTSLDVINNEVMSFKFDFDNEALHYSFQPNTKNIFELNMTQFVYESYEDESNNFIYNNDNEEKFPFYSFLPMFGRFQNYDFCNKIFYISAERITPKTYYAKLAFDTDNNLGVGKQGEYVYSIFDEKRDYLIHKNLILDNTDAHTLEGQTEHWISKILGKTKLFVPKNDQSSVYEVTFKSPAGKVVKPINTGFGFTYVLPIIIAGLTAKEGDFLIIDAPEAHLHARAQSEIAKFLSLVASTGVQVVIETHSDHVLNGLRLAVKNKLLKPNEVSILSFAEDPRDSHKIEITDEGKLTEWPSYFFDQYGNDLNELW